MRRFFVVTLILTVTVVFAGSGDARTRRVSLPDPMDAIVQVATYQAVAGQNYVGQLQREQYVALVVEYLESVPVAAPTVSRPQVAPVVGSAGGGGHSDAWWAAIAQCESGMQSGWRTGFFGIMDSSAAGSMPYEQQLARAREIWARAGDGAWGCSGRAYAAVPGG